MIDAGIADKVAIVTGANNPMGIGAAICRALAAQGVRVFATYLRCEVSPAVAHEAAKGVPGEALYQWLSSKACDDLVADIRSAGGAIEAMEVDLADAASPRAVFDEAERRLGPVEILVNNAAFSVPDSLLPEEITGGTPSAGGFSIAESDVGQHDRHFQVNVRAPALLMREFARRHIARSGHWGRIVNVSTDGASCFPTEVSYGASKHALESVTRSAAVELGPYGITANVAALGPIQTGYIPPDAENRIASQTPLRRVGRPDDVADVVALLVSDQARWLTGQLIHVGGGHAMRH